MTIKELKERFPLYKLVGMEINTAKLSNDFGNGDIVWSYMVYEKNSRVYFAWETKPKLILSKEKLDKVIQLNRDYFKAPCGSFERDNAIEELKKAEEECGAIYDTNLLDIIGSITLSTKAHDTPNETIYKVFEALGYEIK